MDLQPQPRSLTEYGNNVITQLYKSSPLSIQHVVQFVHDLASFAPPQMSLTLEEKQRLAKEQEQAAKLRNQQPLAPQTIKPASNTNSKVMPEHVSVNKHMLKHSWLMMINLTPFYVAD